MAFADLFGRDPLELWLLGGLAVVMLAALARTAWRRRLLRGRSDDIDPFLVFPENTVRHPMTPAPIGGLAWAPPAADGDDDDDLPYEPTSRPAQSMPTPAPAPAPPPTAAPTPGPRPLPAPIGTAAYRPAPVTPGPSWSARRSPQAVQEVDEASETIRLPTAADGTVQLLPGMLVMTEGPEVGREYRFLRIGSQPVPEVTVGRASGPPYRHIHIAAATVSRMHARIRYEDGCWRIANLSATNPLAINGRELPPMQDSPLADGDRVQLGEVELCYRDRGL